MGRNLMAAVLLGALASPLAAQPGFSDDFEPNGVDHGIWPKWPEATETLQTDTGHVRSPTHSARAVEADPWGYASYHDFGATSGAVYAEVWVFDPLDDDGQDPDRPVSNMLALVAGSPAGPSGWNYTDYLQLGVVAWYDDDGLSDTYSIRTRYRDDAGPEIADYIDTGVPRREGWIKLGIAAASLADGGQVRFYVDGELVAISYRTAGVDLQYVRLGVNFKSYDDFWYDDVVVSDALPADGVRFDVDDDGDVDQDDFARFQECHTGPGGSYDYLACWQMDADDDGDIDTTDGSAFEACASGPAILAEVACDNTPPAP